MPLAKWRKNKFSLSTIKEFWQLINELRQEHYDIAIDCQQMFKNFWTFLLCGAKRRITYSFAKELSFLAGNEWVKPKAKFKDNNYHIVERNLDFARYLGVNVDSVKFTLPENSDEIKQQAIGLLSNLDKNKKTIAIAPATTWVNKHWSEDNWKALINSLSNDYNLIFTGTSQDTALIERISDNQFLNLAGKTNLNLLREIFTLCDLVISPDSGSAHLAWASQKPAVIAIFTCTPPLRFGPYGDKYFSVISNLSCQPCFSRKCKNKSFECCKFPNVDDILSIVNKVL